MTGTLQDYATAVTNVIAICRDAEQGYRSAADAVKDPVLKGLFEQYSLQRGAFANELQIAIRAMGYEPPHPSGVGGMVHGAWMSIKGALTGNSAHPILVEAERGEDWSMKTYRETLATTLPPELKFTIELQYEQVRQAHNHIRGLRDASAPSPETPAPPEPQNP